MNWSEITWDEHLWETVINQLSKTYINIVYGSHCKKNLFHWDRLSWVKVCCANFQMVYIMLNTVYITISNFAIFIVKHYDILYDCTVLFLAMKSPHTLCSSMWIGISWVYFNVVSFWFGVDEISHYHGSLFCILNAVNPQRLPFKRQNPCVNIRCTIY